VPPSGPSHHANYSSRVFAQKDSVTAVSVPQHQLHGTLPKNMHDSSIFLLKFKSMLKTHLFLILVIRLLRSVHCWVCICILWRNTRFWLLLLFSIYILNLFYKINLSYKYVRWFFYCQETFSIWKVEKFHIEITRRKKCNCFLLVKISWRNVFKKNCFSPFLKIIRRFFCVLKIWRFHEYCYSWADKY